MPLTIVYTGIDGGAFINSITGPAPGVFVTAASLGLVAQGTANNFKWGVDHWVNGVDNGGSYAGHISFTHLQTIVIDVSLTVNGPVQIIDGGSGLQVTGPTILTGDLGITGGFVQTGDMSVSGEIHAGTLRVDGDSDLKGDVLVELNLEVQGSTKSTSFQYETPVTYNRTVEQAPHPTLTNPNTWTPTTNDDNWETLIGAGLDFAQLAIRPHLPHNCALNSFTVYIKGPTGHAAFPGGSPYLPVVTVYSKAKSTGVSTSLGAHTDTSANVGAYQANHTITCTLGSPHTVDRQNEVIWVLLAAEGDKSGAGGEAPIAGTLYYESSVNYTVSEATSE